MPYIESYRRQHARTYPDNSGELNYAITIMLQDYMQRTNGHPNYDMFNEVVGVLECVKLELYRRVISEYEDTKNRSNGEVYTI